MNIRDYEEKYFADIQQLNKEEGWSNLVKHDEETRLAWENSNVTMVAEVENNIVGYIRGLTDGAVTLYICELLIKKSYRGIGIGQALLNACHNRYPKTRMEMLASTSSETYYKQLGFRPFYGYRKTIEE
ncbi:putative N-acetyltransferase YhbS [Salirhabdus euzebyi]|uniref:Putative N-acetyltransferase YhbS n=1 Tax=Salirhabdus euzebyi TaxID=394506 RepID=A0A841Q9K5_9BACI|nr:GNAT family N-acetyltransferase [Salirhabdus euzebyi]MBB6455076.1 putative N-acetyltransferase YhbS [Salirhabdus euzebyi]